MRELLPRVFVIGFILIYTGLIIGLLVWNFGGRLRGSR
jgi:hypothetical protein